MTMRLTFGVDPGLGGAIATLLDGEPGPMIDMPLMRDPAAKVGEVDARALADFIGGVLAAHPGAYVSACVEKVRAMPNKQNGERRTMGAQSSFNFGDGFGQVKAVLRVKRIPMILVEARTWKGYYNLLGCSKDASLGLARLRFPAAAADLRRKKDNGRADALLLALWRESTEMRGSRAA
jgi:crossover junction endodeoxyribonuclease RuvC